MKFTTTSRQTTDHGVKILVYGPSGQGKTMLAASLPKPIMISAESGLLSLSKANVERVFGKDDPAITYDMPVILIEGIEDFEKAYEFVMSEQGKRFESVAIDSLSEIAERILNQEKGLTKDPRKAYGAVIDRTEEMVRKYRDIPNKNIYMSAKQEIIKDEDTGYMKYFPAMPGAKLGQKLPYFFDEVFLAKNIKHGPENKEFRVLMTQVDAQYEAKDRSGALAAIEKPHLGNIINKIKGISA